MMESILKTINTKSSSCQLLHDLHYYSENFYGKHYLMTSLLM